MGLAPYVKKQSTIKIVILVKDPENIYSNEAERADLAIYNIIFKISIKTLQQCKGVL